MSPEGIAQQRARVAPVDPDAEAQKERFRRYTPELGLLLWAVWDPIGAGVPLDEYETYVPTIWRLLQEHAGAEAVSAELTRLSEERMVEVEARTGTRPKASRNGGTGASTSPRSLRRTRNASGAWATACASVPGVTPEQSGACANLTA
jgi:hypothetical protein